MKTSELIEALQDDLDSYGDSFVGLWSLGNEVVTEVLHYDGWPRLISEDWYELTGQPRPNPNLWNGVVDLTTPDFYSRDGDPCWFYEDTIVYRDKLS